MHVGRDDQPLLVHPGWAQDLTCSWPHGYIHCVIITKVAIPALSRGEHAPSPGCG
jgi:hypothetical protein